MQNTPLYYLPGHGGSLHTGLGAELQRRGYTLEGRETSGAFVKRSFGEQIEQIAEDLQQRYWQHEARVIANSFGAYLFLHAQTLLPAFPGTVLLLSPIIGAFAEPGIGRRFLPPRRERLMQLASAGQLAMPTRCQIHVGAEDWQSRPAALCQFADLLGIAVTVVADNGHQLDQQYVRKLLDAWAEPVSQH